MDEIEVKILEIDVDKTIKKIEALGAKKVFNGDVISVFFDKPDHSLHDNKTLVRLRKLGDKVLLTLKTKGTKTDVKSFEEHETYVEDFEQMKQVLLHIGLVAFDEDEKKRISYHRGKIGYEIEFRKDIPPYLEVEAHSKKELEGALKELGYTLKDAKPWGGAEVLRHYGKKTKFKF